MVFFDYIYYRIYSLYLNKFKDDIPMVYSISALSLVQYFNLFFVLTLLGKVNFLSIHLVSRNGSIYLFLILLAINFFRYHFWCKYESLLDKWSCEKISVKSFRGKAILIYFLLSMITPLVLVASY